MQILVNTQELSGEQLQRAQTVAGNFFTALGVTPFRAAQCAFVQEGSDERALTDQEGEWAEAWRQVRLVVAEALGTDPDQTEVNLDNEEMREKALVRRSSKA